MTPDLRGRPGPIGRRIRKAADIVFHGALRGAAAVFGFKPRHRARDRRILDEEILPKLARNPRFARVLFVGCDWYTEHVEGPFTSAGRTYATIEIDPVRARHGAKTHIEGALKDLGRHFEAAGSLDLIVCNGVIGWGLDEPDEIEASLSACARALSPGGVLLLGWDDVPEKMPMPVDRIAALRALEARAPEGFADAVIQTGTYTNHTFGFFRKPDAV